MPKLRRREGADSPDAPKQKENGEKQQGIGMRFVCKNVEYARILAVLCVFLGLGFGLVGLATIGNKAVGGHDLTPLCWGSLVCFGIAIPLYFGNRIVLYGVALLSCVEGLWLGIGSILQVPFPFWILNLLFSLVFWLPAWLCYRAEK